MLRPRVTPCLLLSDGQLVKTTHFKDPKYVGDPVNAIRIFNEKHADELIVVDIDATVHGRDPDFALIAKLASECQMPICYAGGVRNVEHAKRLISIGVEKVGISSAALNDVNLLSDISTAIGRQSVVGVLDYKKKKSILRSDYYVYTKNGTQAHKLRLLDVARQFQVAGVGELLVNDIDRDGAMQGYNLDVAAQLMEIVTTPITFLGGAGSLDDISDLVERCGTVGAAAGSLFVFKGRFRAVLINYPTEAEKETLLRYLPR